ncbi:MAG: PKD domain-containing protein [Methanomicrobiales archaeon]|nr:PKD domain-containing protein [Methanomicrobiales archaeon]
MKTSYITVTASPGTDFSINPEIASIGEQIQFTDLSVPKPLTYLWDFGDGTTSPLESPVHKYDKPGLKDVTLTISNQYGIGEPLTKQVLIKKHAPVADFAASPVSTSGYPGRIFFTDLSEYQELSEIESWTWVFTEITTGVTLASNEQNPMIVFNEPGVYTVSLTVENNGGGSTEVKEAYITIGAEDYVPTASFTANPLWGPEPLTVQFTDTSNIKPKTLTWDFGDGETLIWECTEGCALDPSDPKRNPKHTYQKAGTYHVVLTADDGLGVYVSKPPTTITVGGTPEAKFRIDKEVDGKEVRIGIGETVRFIDESTGNPTSWKWDFGDGSTSALQSPMHSYSKAGTYTISLSVSNVYGESKPFTKTIVVTNDLPVASFYSTPYESSKNPVRVSFTDTSTGYIEKWNWIFEFDEQVIGTSAEQNPVMIFDKPGDYKITLIVSNNGGSSNEAVGTVTVGNERAKVFFDATPLWGLAPLTVQFTDRSDPELKPKTLTWDFGDGETLVWECTGDCPLDPTRNPEHTYQKPGCYYVTLTADDGLALYISEPVEIVVGGPPIAAFRMDKPIVEDKVVVRIGEEISFTDLSTGDPTDLSLGNPTSWNWNFGDGSTSALQSPMYSYSTPGEYTVSLSVSNIFGASKVPATATILVTNEAPVASFYATPLDSPKNPVRVFFTDTSSGYIDDWHWTFELDEKVIGTSAEQHPVMIFDKPGIYTIILVVSNNGGSSNEAVGNVTVGNKRAEVFFDADPLWGPEPLTVQFTERSDPELKPKTLIWDFGDGETLVWECTGDCPLDPTDSTRNPQHTYQNAGSYYVTLTADDGLALYVSEPVMITVGSAPQANFRMSKDIASIGEDVLFTDISTGDPDSWQWKFGDGSWSSLRSPVHSYSQSGTYEVTLTVGNRYTSSASVTKSILIVEDAPTQANIDFEVHPQKNPWLPTTMQCTDLSQGVVITSWDWEFIRDGVVVWCSSEQNPIAVISEPGIYDVRLTIRNNGGEASLTKKRYVVIGEGNSVLIYPGWNHVSVPVELANGFNTMADVFAGIQTGAWPYSVYSWERQDWMEVPDNYIVTPLELVRVNSAEPGVIEGTFVFATREGNYQTTLLPGWNGIGISAWQPIIASEALASIEGKWDRAIGYDPVRQVWEDPIYSAINADKRYMHPAMGYLILMDEEASFTSGVKL